MKKSLKASAKKVKPVKAWIVVNAGVFVSIGRTKHMAWLGAGFPAYSCNEDYCNEWMRIQSLEGYRCIRVTITPAA